MSRRTTSLTVAAALATTATVAAMAACSPSHHAVVVTSQPAAAGYGMAAYGQNGQCYYIDSPQEATALIAAGLCPAAWVPTLMPLAWHEEYLDYYNSPVYQAYVPASYRPGWSAQWGPSSPWYQSNKTTIVVIQKKAVYKDTSGNTVAATAIPSSKMSFGSGVKPVQSFGSVAPKPAPSADKSKASLGGGVTGGASSKAKTGFGSAAPKRPAPVVPR